MHGGVSGEPCSHGGCVAVWEGSDGDNCECTWDCMEGDGEIDDGNDWDREGVHDAVVCDKKFEWSPPKKIYGNQKSSYLPSKAGLPILPQIAKSVKYW